MKDKFLFFLFIFFAALSVYSYDQYVTQKGEVGPIAKAISWLNVEEAKKESKVVRKAIRLTFEQRIRGEFDNLNKKLDFISEQKKELISQRRDVIKELLEINEQLRKQAEEYKNEIAKQRRLFIEDSYELKQLSLDLIEIHKLNDTDLRKNRYRILENNLLDIIDRLIDYPDEDVKRLKSILFSIEQIVMESGELLVDKCDDYDECLQKRTESINDELTRIFEPVLKDSGRKLEKFMELLNLLEYEYLLQQDNMDVSVENEVEINKKIYGSEQKLVTQFILITKNDLVDLIYVYKSINLEYKKQLIALKNNEEKWQNNTMWAIEQVEQVMGDLDSIDEIDFTKLINKFDETKTKYLSLLEDLKLNGEQLRQALNHGLFEHRKFFSQLCDSMNIDVERLISDVTYAAGVNNTYLRMRNKMKRKKKKTR